jgi:hypothetical protein
MEHGHLSMVADQCQWVCSEPLRNTCGPEAPFGRRQRLITPLRLGLALTTTCASQAGETSAACPCAFHTFGGTTIRAHAFYNHVATPQFAAFARPMAARLIRAMTLQGLGGETGHAWSELRPMLLQDGSSCAIHDDWLAVLPGRVKGVQPAAGALPTTRDLLGDAPTTVGLLPDTAKAQAFLPEPAALRDSVLLADRGSVDLHYLRRVQDEHGFLLIRTKAGIHPQVVEAWREDGKRLQALRNSPVNGHTRGLNC